MKKRQAKRTLRWVWFKTHWLSEELMDAKALDYAIAVEKVAKAKHLYFCRYSQLEVRDGDKVWTAWTEIKMLTAAPEARLHKVWAGTGMIRSVTVKPCDPCSIAHSQAFQVAKAIGNSRGKPWPLADVIHWLCNMSGLTYMQEVQLYCASTSHFAQQKEQQEAAHKKLLLGSTNR